MKKWIGMLLVAALLVLAGCGAKQRDGDGAVNRDVETEQIESICGKTAAQAILPGA